MAQFVKIKTSHKFKLATTITSNRTREALAELSGYFIARLYLPFPAQASCTRVKHKEDDRMIKYGELNRALARYTKADIHEDIPIDYYRRVIKAWFRANNKGLNWDIQQSASTLIYLAFNEGILHPSQLNTDGLKALDWGEKFLQQIKTDTNENIDVLDALKIA